MGTFWRWLIDQDSSCRAISQLDREEGNDHVVAKALSLPGFRPRYWCGPNACTSCTKLMLLWVGEKARRNRDVERKDPDKMCKRLEVEFRP